MISAIFRFLIGGVFGIASALALSPALAAFQTDEADVSMGLTYAVIILVAVLAAFAPSIRRAFGRGFLTLGSCFIFLPISTLILSGKVASDVISANAPGDQAAAAAGAGLAGAALTGAALFFGLILGAICLTIGLVLALGGRREVIVVEAAKQ